MLPSGETTMLAPGGDNGIPFQSQTVGDVMFVIQSHQHADHCPEPEEKGTKVPECPDALPVQTPRPIKVFISYRGTHSLPTMDVRLDLHPPVTAEYLRAVEEVVKDLYKANFGATLADRENWQLLCPACGRVVRGVWQEVGNRKRDHDTIEEHVVAHKPEEMENV